MAAQLETILADLNGPVAGAAAARGAHVELEIRFDGSSYELYSDLYDKLMAGAAAGEYAVAMEHSINTIRDAPHQRRSQNLSQNIYQLALRPDGTRSGSYHSKARISRPARVSIAPGAVFRVALNIEEGIPAFALEGGKFRLKNRLSFARAPGGAAHDLDGWRVDLTIVRELDGSMSGTLGDIVPAMFSLDAATRATRQRPETLLQCLNLRGDGVTTMVKQATQATYRYEIEIEHTGPRDRVTADGVHRAARTIMRMVNPDCLTAAHMQAELARAASQFMTSSTAIQKFASGEWGLKQLTPQAVGLTAGEYAEIYPPAGAYLSDKAHGLHALLVVRDGHLMVIAPGWGVSRAGGGDMAEALFPALAQPFTENAISVDAAGLAPAARADVQACTIIDGELLPLGGEGGPFRARFMAFDVVMLKGARTAEAPFEERVAALPAAVAVAAHFGALDVQAKPFIRLGDPATLARDFAAMYRERARPYAVDGLVLYLPGQPYPATKIYKWKPLEENTVDFLARRPGRDVLGRAPYVDIPGHQLYFLFVGISYAMYQRFGLTRCIGYETIFPDQAHARGRAQSDYFPVQFQPTDQPFAFLYYHPDGAEAIEGHIVELRLRGGDPAGADAHAGTPAPAWELMRVRTDRNEDLQRGRLFGNNYVTATMTWLNYRSPLTFDMLAAGPAGGYFQVRKQGIYEAPTRFMAHAKHEVMSAHIAGSPFVIDLGAGRGQDLHRYRRLQVPQVVMVDQDAAALVEFTRRMVNSRPAGKPPARGAARSTRFQALQGDFTAPHAALVARLRQLPGFPAEGASSVVCNLAAHYAFGSEASVANFALLCAGLLRPGGQLILTLLDGRAVFDLLKSVPAGESWDAREHGVLKYSLRRLFAEPKLLGSGQQIGVLLPFSRGEYYTEYLSNVDAVSRVFGKLGLKKLMVNNLWDRYGAEFADSLSDQDKMWLKLFVAVRYIRD